MAGEASRQKRQAPANIELVYNIRVRGLSWPAEVQRDAVDIDPMVERPGDEFRAVVLPDLGGGPPRSNSRRFMTSTASILSDSSYSAGGIFRDRDGLNLVRGFCRMTLLFNLVLVECPFGMH